MNPLMPWQQSPTPVTPTQIYTNPLLAKARPPRPAPDPTTVPPTPPMTSAALEALGNLLDTPGSMVRDAIALKNPFDQLLTLTKPDNRTTGRDLLRAYSLADPHTKTWANALAGFAAEVATDPLTYTGIGALTKAGKIASKAGLIKGSTPLAESTSQTIRSIIESSDDVDAAHRAWKIAGGSDAMLDRPAKAIVSFNVPKLPELALTGKAAAPAAKIIDAIGAKAMDIPGMRNLRAAFDPKVLNTVTKSGQEIAEHRHQLVKDQIASLGKKWAPLVDTPDAAKAAEILNQSKSLAADAGLDVAKLGGDSLSPTLSSAEHLHRAAGMAHAATELLGKTARADGIGVPLDEALRRLGLDTPQATANLSKHLGDDLSSHSIDEHLLNDAVTMIKPFTDPDVKSTARAALDKFNSILKVNLTTPWPSFASRNIASGVLRNVVKGFGDETQSGVMKYARPLIDAYRMTTGKPLRGLAKLPEFKAMGLSDKEASDLLKHEAFAHELIGDSSIAADLGASTSRMPGSGPIFNAPPQGTTWAQAANPLMVAGGLTKDNRFLPARIGGDLAQFGESINRLSGFIALRRSGFSADESSRLIKNSQVDYSQATHFEDKYLTPSVPFWKFSKGMFTDLVDELSHSPGGRTAVSVKANARASQDNPKPHWLRNQTTVPIDGDRTLSMGGLMSDGAATLLGLAAQGDAQGLAADLANRLNPLIKFPIEMASGTSLFHGRPLSTVTPGVGAIIENLRQWQGAEKEKPAAFLHPTLEHILRNSPFSRYIATANKLTNKEKAAQNLISALTGATVD